MKRKLFQTMTVLLMLVYCIPIGARASYSAPSGAGTAQSPYELATSSDLFWFADQVNAGNSSIYAVLVDNIVINPGVFSQDGVYTPKADESPVKWVPIGSSTPFQGSFDGNNYSISGLYMSGNDTYMGLFGQVGSSGSIQNITVKDSYFELKRTDNEIKKTAAVAGEISSSVSGCRVENTTVKSDTPYGFTGGVFADTNSSISECHADETTLVIGVGTVGGICGSLGGSATNCSSAATVKAEGYEGSDDGYDIGGIAGDVSIVGGGEAEIRDCVNTGTVTGRYQVGGICGSAGIDIVNCRNEGDVSAEGYDIYGLMVTASVGGIAGNVSDGTNITGCANTGSIEGNGVAVGGIFGYGSGAEISGCANSGAVTGNGGNVDLEITGNSSFSGIYFNLAAAGGIGGFGTNTISDCVNAGAVSGCETTWVEDPAYNAKADELRGMAASIPAAGGICGVQIGSEDTGITGCISTVEHESEATSGIIGLTLVLTNDDTTDYEKDNFYLAENPSDEDIENGARTAEQFANGQVTFDLNEAAGEDKWGQNLGVDTFPVLGSEDKVYKDPDPVPNPDPGSGEEPEHQFSNTEYFSIETEAGANGSAGVQIGSSTVTKATKNAVVSIVTSPESGYIVDQISVARTDEPGMIVPVNDRTFTMPAYPVTVTVTFKPATLTGTVEIEGAPKYGETLTATLFGSNNTGTLSYQWYRHVESSVAIPNATQREYVVTQDDVQWMLYCVVSSDVQEGARESSDWVGPVPLLTFAEGAVTAAGHTDQYDGQNHSITVSVPEGATVYYSTDGENYEDTVAPSYCDVGEYTVYYRVGKEKYASVTGSAVVSIRQKEVAEPAVLGSYTYDGSEQEVALDGFDDSFMTVTGNKGSSASDEYRAQITLDGNHKWADGADGIVPWSIAKAVPTVTAWPTVKSVYVNDSEVTLNGDGAAEDVSGLPLEGSFALDVVDLTDSGTKTVTLTFTPTDSVNYESVEKTDYTVTVRKRTVESVEALDAITNRLYGTAQSELGLSDTVEITVSGDKKFTVPVVWSGYIATDLEEQTLTGTLNLSAIAEEVEQPSPAVTASIRVDLQEKSAAGFGFGSMGVIYNGLPVAHTLPNGLEGVASVAYSYEGIGGTVYPASPTAPTHVGTYQVTAAITMEPGYAAVEPKTATLTIEPKEVELNWSALSTDELVYSGNAKALTATASGLVDGDVCAVTVELVGDNVNVGSFHYTAKALSSADYTLTTQVDSPAYTITAKEVTVTADDLEMQAGSALSELTYTVEGLLGGDSLSTLPGCSTDANLNRAGTYTITISDADAGSNYTIVHVNGTLTVTGFPVVIRPVYEVKVAQDIPGGAVRADRITVYQNENITLTVRAEDGYELDELTVIDGQGNKLDVAAEDSGVYTFRMPADSVAVSARFVLDGSAETCTGESECPLRDYTDLDPAEWYHNGVHYCIENSLMTGFGDGLFGPDESTTRAMVAVILWNLEGNPVVNYAMNFPDVEEGQWYTEAIRWMRAEGIVVGYGDGRFGTDDAITREQLVTILWNYARYKGVDVSEGEDTNILSYGDALDVADYAVDAMQWACGSGVVYGKNAPDGTGLILDPAGMGTRVQIATMIMNFCVKVIGR